MQPVSSDPLNVLYFYILWGLSYQQSRNNEIRTVLFICLSERTILLPESFNPGCLNAILYQSESTSKVTTGQNPQKKVKKTQAVGADITILLLLSACSMETDTFKSSYNNVARSLSWMPCHWRGIFGPGQYYDAQLLDRIWLASSWLAVLGKRT